MVHPLRFLLFSTLLGALLLLNACQPHQSADPQPANEPIDSLITLTLITNVSDGSPSNPTITLKLPRFEAIVRQSQTPAGELDKTVGTLTDPSAGTQYLYNQQGQPAGFSTFSQNKTWGGTTRYFDYADNRIYRVFTKVYESEMAKDFIYFLDELHYVAGRPTTLYSYYLNLAKGEAYFNSITDFKSDPQGHVTEIRDRRPNSSYSRFTWQGDNIISRQDYNGDDTPVGFGYTYTHDDKVNPLKKFELPYMPVSGNNELSQTARYTNVNLVDQTLYELSYDPSGALASSVTVQLGTASPRQPPVFYFYK